MSRHLHEVLIALLKLSMEYIRSLDPLFRDSHAKIENDTWYWPFFKNVIGTNDGTHVPCMITHSEQARFIRRKGIPTQNIMVVCGWNMCFYFCINRMGRYHP